MASYLVDIFVKICLFSYLGALLSNFLELTPDFQINTFRDVILTFIMLIFLLIFVLTFLFILISIHYYSQLKVRTQKVKFFKH